MNVKSVLYRNMAHFDERLGIEGSVIANEAAIQAITADDILILHGGTDIDTKLYGEAPEAHTDTPDRRRDAFEVKCIKKGMEVGAKFYGVCRGAQLLTALNGGKLIQHITGHHGNHSLDEFKGISTTSCHHQAMIPPEKAQIIASHDGIPEIVYYPATQSFCVQGHPEWMDNSHPFVDLNFNLIQKLWSL